MEYEVTVSSDTFVTVGCGHPKSARILVDEQIAGKIGEVKVTPISFPLFALQAIFRNIFQRLNRVSFFSSSRDNFSGEAAVIPEIKLLKNKTIATNEGRVCLLAE